MDQRFHAQGHRTISKSFLLKTLNFRRNIWSSFSVHVVTFGLYISLHGKRLERRFLLLCTYIKHFFFQLLADSTFVIIKPVFMFPYLKSKYIDTRGINLIFKVFPYTTKSANNQAIQLSLHKHIFLVCLHRDALGVSLQVYDSFCEQGVKTFIALNYSWHIHFRHHFYHVYEWWWSLSCDCLDLVWVQVILYLNFYWFRVLQTVKLSSEKKLKKPQTISIYYINAINDQVYSHHKIPANMNITITKDDHLIIWGWDNSSTEIFIKSHDNLLISLEGWGVYRE